MNLRDPFNTALSTIATYRLHLVVGGAKEPLLPGLLNRTQAGLSPHEDVSVFDNLVEIEAIRQRYDHKQIITGVLGEGLTSHAVARNASPAVSAAAARTNNSGMGSGFGGRGSNARLAAERYIRSTEFKDYLDSIAERALAATNAAPGRIVLEVYGSIGGSAYAAAAPLFVLAIVTRLVALGVEVSVRYHALGPSTFTGVAKRSWPNAACAVLAHLLAMKDSSNPELDLVTRQLLLHELPPFKDDMERRAKYLRYDAAAMRSRQVNSYFDLIQANHNMDGQWGGVVSRQVSFFPGLNHEKEIASLIALSLRKELQSELLSLEVDPLLVSALHWRDESEPTRRLSLEEIVEQVEQVEVAETKRRIAQAEARYKFRIFLETAEGTEFALERLSQDLCLTPRNLPDFRYRLQLLGACSVRLDEERQWIEDDLNQIADEILELEDDVQQLCDRIQAGSIFGTSSKRRRLGNSAAALRTLHERRTVRLAEREAIDRATAETSHLQDQHLTSLMEIESVLDSFVPRGAVMKLADLVNPASLAEVFVDITTLPQLPRWEQINRLCGFANKVTPKGLASILGERSDRLEILADRIVHAMYPIESPPHGARRRSHPAQVFYILPPMAELIASQLGELILDRHDGAKVMFCDSLTCGATVMRMSLFRFDTVNEIFDGLLGHALKQALDEPLTALNANDLLEGIKTLGGRVVGNRVVFDVPDAGDVQI